ncbi:hypothetical protein A8C56_22005 [Niabella ginsenosidivorans]|uniref:Phosphatase PAP2 family protein n=1 Tax=Niabella ginsenosidivorans TaxID=1176587 RepID=A0A1A9I899_9BACT|nr:hypothetical protein [Niabella ginsenosidivorans]ANH83299.1 hypothetical protein A8C56_22005 [Niabella ginsenosidivorans]
MESKMVLDSDNELRETIDRQPKAQKVIATLLSYIFHPVFIPVYIICFLLFTEPFLFVALPVSTEEVVIRAKMRILLQGLINYTFFPLVTVLLLKGVGFISSIKLKERKDRIIPFIACNIWYFWIWYVWRGLDDIPRELVVLAMAVFMASSIGLLFNIYMKISMHGIALGTAVAFLCYLGFEYGQGMGFYIIIALLISGLVCTARLLLSDHTAREVYWGLAVGVMGLLIANFVV